MIGVEHYRSTSPFTDYPGFLGLLPLPTTDLKQFFEKFDITKGKKTREGTGV